ncbi:MAG: transcriptional regulator NrdR [Myxococcota bacterium]
MRCPFCGAFDNRVIDSRMARDGRAIRRRRKCAECAERFTTYEEIEETRPDVVKRDDRTEPFSRDKLLQSLRLACKKRPVDLETLTAFVEHLEAKLAVYPRKAITSEEVGDKVLVFLREQDPVAYVRYASVYRSFASVDEFMEELRSFRDEPPEEPDLP